MTNITSCKEVMKRFKSHHKVVFLIVFKVYTLIAMYSKKQKCGDFPLLSATSYYIHLIQCSGNLLYD